jgi:cytochrome oxidase Cu insertion factor (SCO1/SenC/PrrC family)
VKRGATTGALLTAMGLAVAIGLAPQFAAPARAHEANVEEAPAPAENRGPFSLTDHTGRAVTDRDFVGHFILVYFGYTHCPDVCPVDLQVMSDAVDLLGADGEEVQPIFITTDPARDTVAVLAGYVGDFHPHLIGLTGDAAQVASATDTYHVRTMKLYPMSFDDEEGDEDEKASGDEGNSRYLIDHSASIYLIGPDGAGLSRFPNGILPEQIVADVKRFFEDYP